MRYSRTSQSCTILHEKSERCTRRFVCKDQHQAIASQREDSFRRHKHGCCTQRRPARPFRFSLSTISNGQGLRMASTQTRGRGAESSRRPQRDPCMSEGQHMDGMQTEQRRRETTTQPVFSRPPSRVPRTPRPLPRPRGLQDPRPRHVHVARAVLSRQTARIRHTRGQFWGTGHCGGLRTGSEAPQLTSHWPSS